jgi:hypothetical protein
MTATTVERLTNMTAPLTPAHGTFPIAANTLLLKGTIACLDSADRLCVPGAGCDAIGMLEATYRNRTTDPATGGGTAGAAGRIDGEVRYGVHEWLISGTTPRPRQVVYVVDNQTVSVDPTGNRGIAGIVSEVRTENGVARAYVYMGPHVIAFIRGSLDIDIPLGGFRLATGAAVPAFSAGVADGYTLADSEALSLRINDDSTTVFWNAVKLPEQVPAGATVTLHVLMSRVGALDVAAVLLTPTVFANREGVAYDAGTNLVSGTFALIADATKVVAERTVSIVGALGGDVLSVSLVAAAGLDDDDLVIHAVWISIR